MTKLLVLNSLSSRTSSSYREARKWWQSFFKVIKRGMKSWVLSLLRQLWVISWLSVLWDNKVSRLECSIWRDPLPHLNTTSSTRRMTFSILTFSSRNLFSRECRPSSMQKGSSRLKRPINWSSRSMRAFNLPERTSSLTICCTTLPPSNWRS